MHHEAACTVASRHRHRRAGVLATLGVLLLAFAGCSDDSNNGGDGTSDAPTTNDASVTGRGADRIDPSSADALSRIAEGDCYDIKPPAYRELEVVPCTDPHRSEVIAILPIPSGLGASYAPAGRPSAADPLQQKARSLCEDALTEVLASDDRTTFQAAHLAPNAAQWAAGADNRRIVCAASKIGDPATAPLASVHP